MRIFGRFLPFVGFRKLSRVDMPEMDYILPAPEHGYCWQTFEIEWFGIGIILAAWQTPFQTGVQ